MGSVDDQGTRSGSSRSAVYRVSDVGAQQAVLDDFHTAAMTGVVALGTNGPEGPRVVVRCETVGDEVLVDHVVRQLDPGAERVEGEPGPMLHSTGPVTSFDDQP